MAQFGKASSKRGKPSYIYAIIGVALVLFLFGIVGWFFLNIRKTGDYFKESIQVSAYLNPDATTKVIDSATKYIASLPSIKSVKYVSKAMAIKAYENEADTTWRSFIKANPLPASIDYFVKANYVESDSLNKIASRIQELYPGLVSEFKFPQEMVAKVGSFAKTVVLGFLIAAILLTILVIFSIDNTIRLAMYSNRFLIKTMQMVGATRFFIAKPINIRSIINGLIASLIAIALLLLFVFLLESFGPPEIKILRDNKNMVLLFLTMIILGITINLISTHRAVIKYLKLKLDDLY